MVDGRPGHRRLRAHHRNAAARHRLVWNVRAAAVLAEPPEPWRRRGRNAGSGRDANAAAGVPQRFAGDERRGVAGRTDRVHRNCRAPSRPAARRCGPPRRAAGVGALWRVVSRRLRRRRAHGHGAHRGSGRNRDRSHRGTLFPMVARATRLIVALAVAAALACSGPPSHDTTRTAPARRIISLVPALTEILFAIGAGPQVLAVRSYDDDPPEAKMLPRVGALLGPDAERLLAPRPDRVPGH